MKKRKNYDWGIIILWEDGSFSFVTKLQGSSLSYEKGEPVLKMSEELATETAWAMNVNNYVAMPIKIADYIIGLKN